jgi:hypothetical protein
MGCEICGRAAGEITTDEAGREGCRDCLEEWAQQEAEAAYEQALDETLAQQELGDFEKADEWFGGSSEAPW